MNSDVPQEELFSAYLDGELSAAQRAEVERLLAASPQARQLLDDLRFLGATLQAMPQHKLGEDISPRVLRAVERQMLAGEAEKPPEKPQPAPALRQSRLRHMLSRRALLWSGLAVAIAILLMLGEPRREQQPGQRQVALAPSAPSPKGESADARATVETDAERRPDTSRHRSLATVPNDRLEPLDADESGKKKLVDDRSAAPLAVGELPPAAEPNALGDGSQKFGQASGMLGVPSEIPEAAAPLAATKPPTEIEKSLAESEAAGQKAEKSADDLKPAEIGVKIVEKPAPQTGTPENKAKSTSDVAESAPSAAAPGEPPAGVASPNAPASTPSVPALDRLTEETVEKAKTAEKPEMTEPAPSVPAERSEVTQRPIPAKRAGGSAVAAINASPVRQQAAAPAGGMLVVQCQVTRAAAASQSFAKLLADHQIAWEESTAQGGPAGAATDEKIQNYAMRRAAGGAQARSRLGLTSRESATSEPLQLIYVEAPSDHIQAALTQLAAEKEKFPAVTVESLPGVEPQSLGQSGRRDSSSFQAKQARQEVGAPAAGSAGTEGDRQLNTSGASELRDTSPASSLGRAQRIAVPTTPYDASPPRGAGAAGRGGRQFQPQSPPGPARHPGITEGMKPSEARSQPAGQQPAASSPQATIGDGGSGQAPQASPAEPPPAAEAASPSAGQAPATAEAQPATPPQEPAAAEQAEQAVDKPTADTQAEPKPEKGSTLNERSAEGASVPPPAPVAGERLKYGVEPGRQAATSEPPRGLFSVQNTIPPDNRPTGPTPSRPQRTQQATQQQMTQQMTRALFVLRLVGPEVRPTPAQPIGSEPASPAQEP